LFVCFFFFLKKKEFQKYFFKKYQLATCIFIHVSNRMPRVIYTCGQLFLRRIWPRGQKKTLPSGRVSTVTGTVDTRRFSVFFVVRFLASVRFRNRTAQSKILPQETSSHNYFNYGKFLYDPDHQNLFKSM